MTTSLPGTPFLVRLSVPIPTRPTRELVYDPLRQLARASVNGTWQDALDIVGIDDPPQTLVTEVRVETTDDS